MAFKKINKKGGSGANVMSLIFGLILVMALFTGMYLWLNYNIETSGRTMDTKYGESYNRMLAAQENLSNNVNDMKEGIASITEADKNFFGMAGLKGLLALIRTPAALLDVAFTTSDSVFTTVTAVPTWVIVLYYIGIAAFIIVIIIATLKGEQGSMK